MIHISKLYYDTYQNYTMIQNFSFSKCPLRIRSLHGTLDRKLLVCLGSQLLEQENFDKFLDPEEIKKYCTGGGRDNYDMPEDTDRSLNIAKEIIAPEDRNGKENLE